MLRSLLVYLLVIISTALFGQSRQVQTYSVADGLAQSQVYAVWAGAHGYVWAGTQGGGLSRFDGLEFKTFSTADGLPGNNINDIWQDEEDNLWIATDYGLGRYDGQEFIEYLPGRKIRAIDGRGKELWVLAESSLYIREQEENKWNEIELPESSVFIHDLIVEKNRLLIGTDQGVWQWRRNRWTKLVEPDNTPQVWSLYQYHDAQTWGVSTNGQLFAIGKDSLRERPIPDCIPTVFYISDQGDSWLGTKMKGIFVLLKGATEWQRITTQNGLGSDFIRSITADDWGNIWVGNSGGGLSCLRESPFRSFDQQRGLPGKEVYTLIEDDSLGLLLSLNGKGIYHQTDQGPVNFNQDEALRGLKIKTFVVDERQRLWIGTQEEGIKMKADSSWLDIKNCGIQIQDLLQAKNNEFWVATAYRLSLLKMEEDSNGVQFTCQTFDEKDKLPEGRIESLNYDQGGKLLITYRNSGVACWSPGDLRWHVTKKDGLASSSVRAICQDSMSYYWLATPNGLIRLGWKANSPQIKVFNTSNGLKSSNLYSLVLDQDQSLWVGSEQGVDQIVLNEARLPSKVKFYGKEEGFTGIENCSDAALMDKEGNLWFGTMSGLMLKPNKSFEFKKSAPPELMIGDISIFYESIRKRENQDVLSSWGDARSPLMLEHDDNHIGIHLAGLDLAYPKDIQYQWKLEGWDQQWSPLQAQKDITYSNLPPGDYHFLARAVGKGNRKSEVLTIDFQIIPAFWQTVWFRTSMIIAGSLLLLFFIVWWIRRWQRKQKQVEERLRLDHKLLELEQKALQLQMNPHFLANALQGIQYELGHGDHDKASRYLHKFGEYMRATLYHSRSSKITLADELDNLKHYLEIEKFRLGNRFSYNFDLSEDLEVDLIYIPPMLLQPFLENAIHHGMQTKESGGKLDVFVKELDLKNIQITIRDNGPGLGQNVKNTKTNHRSTALKVIQERLQLLGKAMTSKAFSMKEIKENQVVQGVEVEIVLPVLD